MAIERFRETRIQSYVEPHHLKDAVGSLALGQRYQTAIPLRPLSVGLYTGEVNSRRNGYTTTVYDHDLPESYVSEAALRTLIDGPKSVRLAYTPATDAVVTVETTPLDAEQQRVQRKISISSGILAIQGNITMHEDLNGLVDMVAQGRKFDTPLVIDEEVGYWPDHRIAVDFAIREQTDVQPALSVVAALE